MRVVGNYFKAFSIKHNDGMTVFKCTSYDPNCGYWMETLDGVYRTNVSERAINQTFHLCYKNGKRKYNSYEEPT